VSEYRVLREVFGPKRDKVTGEWRRLHNEDFRDLYLPSIFRVMKSRRIRWAGRMERIGDRRGSCRVLVVRRGGRRQLGRSKLSWDDNIKMDLQEVGWGDLN
jgi:hypothetical protein